MEVDKILSIKDNTEYGSHVEIIRLFGKELNGHQQATWHPEGVKDWFIWMPIIPRSETKITTTAVNSTVDEYLKPNAPDSDPSFMRLVFSKEKKNSSSYKFKGVYVIDSSRTKEGNHIFRHIAESVLLKGDIVKEVVPL